MSNFSHYDDGTRRRGGEPTWETTQELPSFDSPYYQDQHTQDQSTRTSPYFPTWPAPAPPPLPPTYPYQRPVRKRHRVRNTLVTIGVIILILGLLSASKHPRGTGSAATTNATLPPPTATSTPVPAFAATLLANNVGISDDGDFRAGNLDSFGDSFSAQALAQAKLIRGAQFVYDNVSFTWPDVASGDPDDMQVQQQQIDVTAATPYTTLAFLGASHFGPAQCTLTLSYMDGTTQTATLGFSDWTLGWGGVQYGNAIVATMPYHNNGSQSHVNGKNYVFYAKIALQSHKILKSIIFPQVTSLGQMHIFSIGVK